MAGDTASDAFIPSAYLNDALSTPKQIVPPTTLSTLFDVDFFILQESAPHFPAILSSYFL